MKKNTELPQASQRAKEHADRMIACEFATEEDRYRIEGAFDAGYVSREQIFKGLVEMFTDFSIKTFEKATAQSSLDKLIEEVEEVSNEIQHGGKDVAEEYVDCLMCIFDSAKRMNISFQTLQIAFEKKLLKNLGRKWVMNDNHTYSHV